MRDCYETASLYAIMWSCALETLAERSQASLAREIAYRLKELVPLLTYMMPSWYHERRHCTASARSAFVWGLCSFTTLPAVLNNRSSAAVDAGAASKVNARCLNTG